MSPDRTSTPSSWRFAGPWRRQAPGPRGATSGRNSSRASERPGRHRGRTAGARQAARQGGIVTERLEDVVLTRPTTARPGPLDEHLYDLVEARFRRIIRDNPVVGTYIGIHTEDARLGDGGRDAVLAELSDEKAHLAAVEAVEPAGLSPAGRIERDLEIHNLRRTIVDTEVGRTWERRSTALDAVGDALFLIFAQDFAPLAERLDSITGRLEAVPQYLEESKSRAVGPQVRLWQRLEIESA